MTKFVFGAPEVPNKKRILLKFITMLVFTVLLSATFAFAGIITGISVIINNEPITLYEVYKYANQFKISKKEAIDMLIRQKLEDAQIKKYGIEVSDFEVDSYIKNEASKNNLSEYDFFAMLQKQNIQREQFKIDIKTKLKRDQLYRNIFAGKAQNIEEGELRAFYESNTKDFQAAKSFTVNIYSSTSEALLGEILKNPMLRPKGVDVQEKQLEAANIDPKLASLLNTTKQGSFTQIINLGDRATMFYVQAKNDLATLPFEAVRGSILNYLSNQREQEIINDYFEKQKASAQIKVLRSPS